MSEGCLLRELNHARLDFSGNPPVLVLSYLVENAGIGVVIQEYNCQQLLIDICVKKRKRLNVARMLEWDVQHLSGKEKCSGCLMRAPRVMLDAVLGKAWASKYTFSFLLEAACCTPTVPQLPK